MDTTAQTDKAARMLEGADRVVVIGHQYPDGDAIGSVLGLGLMLRSRGCDVQASWPEPFDVPLKYSFLPGMEMLVRPERVDFDATVAIALDCATSERLEELAERSLKRPLINIDHHPDNSMYGEANIIRREAAATAQMIHDLIPSFGLALDEDVAVCLYTGLVTDTGRFQFSNTTAETLRVASDLVAAGVEPHRIFTQVYQCDSLAYLRLSGDVMCRAVYEPELGLVYGFLTQKDLKRFGVEMTETEDLIDYLRTLRGHRIVALFKESGDGSIRVSLRSRVDTDVGSTARSLGGGGHRVAAGYTSSKRNMPDALAELKGEILAGPGPGSR